MALNITCFKACVRRNLRFVIPIPIIGAAVNFALGWTFLGLAAGFPASLAVLAAGLLLFITIVAVNCANECK